MPIRDKQLADAIRRLVCLDCNVLVGAVEYDAVGIVCAVRRDHLGAGCDC